MALLGFKDDVECALKEFDEAGRMAYPGIQAFGSVKRTSRFLKELTKTFLEHQRLFLEATSYVDQCVQKEVKFYLEHATMISGGRSITDVAGLDLLGILHIHDRGRPLQRALEPFHSRRVPYEAIKTAKTFRHVRAHSVSLSDDVDPVVCCGVASSLVDISDAASGTAILRAQRKRTTWLVNKVRRLTHLREECWRNFR